MTNSYFFRFLMVVFSVVWVLPLGGAVLDLLQLNDVLLSGAPRLAGGAKDAATAFALAQITQKLLLGMGLLVAAIGIRSLFMPWALPKASVGRRSSGSSADWSQRLSDKEASFDRQLQAMEERLIEQRLALDVQLAPVGEGIDRLNGSVSHRVSLVDSRLATLEEQVITRLQALGDQIGSLARSAQHQRMAEREAVEKLLTSHLDQQSRHWDDLQAQLAVLPSTAEPVQSLAAADPTDEASAVQASLSDLNERLGRFESTLGKLHAVAALNASELHEVRVAAQSGNASWFGELPGAVPSPAATEATRLRTVVLNLSVLQENLREQNRELRKRLQASAPAGVPAAAVAKPESQRRPDLPRAA